MGDVMLGDGLALLAALGYGFWRAILRPGWSERITNALKEVATLVDPAELDHLLVMVSSLSPKTRVRVLKLMNEIAKLEEDRPSPS